MNKNEKRDIYETSKIFIIVGIVLGVLGLSILGTAWERLSTTSIPAARAYNMGIQSVSFILLFLAAITIWIGWYIQRRTNK